jgi:hypothetical protein
MKKLIVVSDWASDSLSCQEFRSTVEGFLQKGNYANISFIFSTPSNIHTGFLIQQIVEIEERYGRTGKTVISGNTDPRIQTDLPVEDGKGAEFVVLRLLNGILVCGPNADCNFSLIKKKIEAAFIYRGLSKGGQFRSRDLYGRVYAHLMEEMEDELELEEIHTNIIPELRGFYIGHIDNFGNIKTTLKFC